MNLLDGISYGSRIFKKSGPPVQLTVFVTSRCNLRCNHCFYWKELDSDHSNELTVDEFEKIAKSLPRLLVLSLTGGEPFVREDISEIYGAFARHTRPHLVTISTNGFYKDRMAATLPRMLAGHPNTNLVVYVSLDGTKETHDAIRGRGSYDKAIAALLMLQGMRKTYKNLSLSASMTLSNGNQHVLPQVFQETMASGLVDNVNIGFVRGDTKDPKAKDVRLDDYRKLTRLKIEAISRKRLGLSKLLFSRLLALREYYTYKTVEQVLERGKAVLPCQAGSLMGILYDDGTVRPCEVLADSKIANIRDFNYDLPALWASERAGKLREKISDGCFCTFECAMSSSILFNPKYLAKIAARAVLG